MNRDYFIDLMSARRMSMRGLAQRMGMQHSQLSLTLSGQRKMQLDEAAQMSQIFGVPLHQIVQNAGVTVRPVTGRRVPVAGFVGKEGQISMHAVDIIERAEAPGDLPDDAVAVQCRTAGTPLEWCDGWLAFYRPSPAVETDAIGRMAVCKTRDGTHYLATINRGYQPDSYNLGGITTRQNVVLESASPVLLVRP